MNLPDFTADNDWNFFNDCAKLCSFNEIFFFSSRHWDGLMKVNVSFPATTT